MHNPLGAYAILKGVNLSMTDTHHNWDQFALFVLFVNRDRSDSVLVRGQSFTDIIMMYCLSSCHGGPDEGGHWQAPTCTTRSSSGESPCQTSPCRPLRIRL